MGRGVKRVVKAEKGRERERETETETETETEKQREREEGASSPFYSESGTPGCCQVIEGGA